MRLQFSALLLITSLPATAAGQTSPDFGAASLASSPGTLELGQTLTITGSVDVSGSYVGNVPIEVVLSNDTVYDPADPVIHTGFIFVPGPGARAFEFAFAVDVPRGRGIIAGLAANVLLVLDPANAHIEADESNNVSGASALTVIGSDIRVDSLVAPDNAFNGREVDVTITLENAGPVDANAFRYRYFLSSDTNIRVFDTAVFTSGEVTVAAGATATFTDSVPIPAEAVTSTGSWFLGVVADIETDLFEISDRNNSAIRRPAILVRTPIPDLIPRFVNTATAGAAGEAFAVTRRILNAGVAMAGRFEYRYVLSRDGVLDANDRTLRSDMVVALPIGDDIDTDVFVIPSSIPPAAYRIGLVVDGDDMVEEIFETNNVAFTDPIEIFPPTFRITTDTLAPAVVGVLYEAAIYTTVAPVPVTFAVQDGVLPSGVTLDPNGILRGTPQQSGLFEFVVRASAATAYSDRTMRLRVVTPSVTPEIVTRRLPAIFAGRDFCRRLVAVGGQVPYRWASLTTLPRGATLGEDGEVCGTIDAPSSYPVTVQLTDDLGETVSAQVEFVVVSPNETIQIDQIPLPIGVVGREVCAPTDVRFSASRGIEPVSWSLLDGDVPGLRLAADGTLCGVPELVGTFHLTVRAQDDVGLFDTSLFTFEVLEGTSFAIATLELPEGQVDKRYEVQFETTRTTGPVHWSVRPGSGDLPRGLSIDADGFLGGAPTEAGTFAFALEAIDAKNQRAIQPYAIVVDPKPTLEEAPGCVCVRATGVAGPSLPSFVWVFAFLLFPFGRRGRGRPRSGDET